MASPTPTQAGNVAGRTPAVIGLILALIGMLMIGYVFYSANQLFSAPGPTVPVLTGTNPNAATNAALSLGASVTTFAQRLLALLVACIAGSVFASAGIKMIFAATNASAAASQASPP